MRVQVAQDYEDLRATAHVPHGQPVGSLRATLHGYHITSFRDDEATLRVLTATVDVNGGQLLVSTEVGMQWTGSDWALLAPRGGSFNSVIAVVPAADTGQYSPFEPGR
jgi:hypothetical protein